MTGSLPGRHQGRTGDPTLVVLIVVAVVAVGAAVRRPEADIVWDVVRTALRAAFVWLCWQVTRQPKIAPAVRRFWRTLTVAGVLFLVGNILLLVAGLDLVSWRDGAVVAARAVAAAGIAVMGIGLVAYPMTVSGRERTRLRLDVATVMCAFAMAAWYLCTPGGDIPDVTGQLAVTVLACVLALLTLLAAVNLLLSGSAPFTPGAGAVLGAAVLVGAWSILYLLDGDTADARLLQGGQMASIALFVIAARVQRLQMRTHPRGLIRRRRPAYSRLPYAAVAVSQVLLVFELLRQGLTVRGWGMVVGVVLVASLVMFRQNLAFADNARLVRRLDASMLRLRRQEHRFRSLVQHASDLTLLVDAQGVITYASPALRDMLGVEPQEAVGRPMAEVVHPGAPAAVVRLLAQARREPDAGVRQLLQVHHVNGSVHWWEAQTTNRLDDPSLNGVIVNIRDVTEARQLEERLRHEATHDHLTGLPNRALLNEKARELLDECVPAARGEAVLLLDLDDFKAVNDRLGHHVGDQLLIAVADRLRECVRPTDTVARLGGDEFVVLLGGTTAAGAAATARRIAEALSRPVLIEGHELPARASIGVAVGACEQFDVLLREADVAMYQAKRDTTGDRVHVVDRTRPALAATVDQGR